MLANTLFYIALLAVAAMTFLSAGLAMTRMTATRLAETYLASGYQRAMSSMRETLAAEMQSGGVPNPLPTFAPLPPTCADAGTCAYQTSATIAFTGGTPAPTATCDPSQSNCAVNEQANAYVNEGRLSARISVVVTTRAGVQLASRASDVILRTIATPPYVVIAGAHDGSLDDIAATRAAGDDGGAPPATPNPCQNSIAGTSDDTAIRVAYQNTATSLCSDGSSWRSSSYTSGASGAGWSP